LIRISGGSERGRRLKSPRGARPTLGRVKKSLFDILAWRLSECSFLDLFAGSGAVGIEALSRGAERAFFVESHAQQASVIRENLSLCGLAEKADVFRGDAARALDWLAGRAIEPFDIMFLDPPYADRDTLDRALKALATHASLLANDGVIIVERARRMPVPEWPEPFEIADSRIFGDTILDFLRMRSER
jgi:16S rRNA (guanine966-N2)-methyltransferase